MLLTLCSLFFFWLVVRELIGTDRAKRSEPIYVPYVILMLSLAVAFGWWPFNTWRFERFLEQKAMILAEGKHVSFHCNTLVDTMFDPNQLAAGHANPETGEIVFQKPWCGVLRDYLDHPENANEKEIFSLSMFTHEVMHIRGELNEGVTECQAVQRNYRAAKLLGVPDSVAKASARSYYETSYLVYRAKSGSFTAHYFSDECAPGKALDERLPDSTWVQ